VLDFIAVPEYAGEIAVTAARIRAGEVGQRDIWAVSETTFLVRTATD
jgi:hypothetical protein